MTAWTIAILYLSWPKNVRFWIVVVASIRYCSERYPLVVVFQSSLRHSKTNCYHSQSSKDGFFDNNDHHRTLHSSCTMGPILFYFTEVALHPWFHEIYFLDLQFGSIKSVAFEIDGIWIIKMWMQFHKEFNPIVYWIATLLCYCYWPVQVSIGWDWAGKMGGRGSSGLGWSGQGRRVGWPSRDLRVVGRWAKQHLRLEICF